MGNYNGNKRRENLGYKYDVFDEVGYLGRTTDLGERVNIFLTELVKMSAVIKLTLSEGDGKDNIYFGADNLKSILSHTKYKEIIEDLSSRGIISRVEFKNRYDVPVYSFKTVFYKPLSQGVAIRNLKVRNGVRKYLGIQNELISDEVHKWIKPALISTEIHISETEFFSNLADKYDKYKANKALKGEKPRSLESYSQDLKQTFLSIRQYQQLTKPRRAGYVREDKFSGRVYNIATGVPRWVRSYLTIQGEPLGEIDMKSSHAVLLWKIVPRTDFVNFLFESTSRGLDIYDRYGELIGITNRKEVKFRFLRSLYGRTSSKYFKEFKRCFPEAGAILEKIKTTDNPRNPSNDKGTHTNLAFKLLNLEVRLFRKVWEGLSLAGIPFLSIHDGILIPVSRIPEGRAIMEEILRAEIPIVETKTVFY